MRTSALRLGLMLGIAAFGQLSPVAAAELVERPLEDVSEVFETSDDPVVSEILTVGLFKESLSGANDAMGHCYSGLRDRCCELPKPRISGCVDNCCEDLGVMASFGGNAFKGISDGGAESNFGYVGSVNVAGTPGMLADRGIALQAGGSYGVYDFHGRSASVSENSSTQEQMFITFGAFHRAHECQHFQGGFVYDIMANDNWGTYANEPFLTQWRVQGEYLLSDYNSVGVTIVRRDRGDSQDVGPAIPGSTAFFRPLSHYDAFFRHRFSNGAESYFWVGLPEKQRPADGPGSYGQFIVGTNFNVPLTESLGLYTNSMYMRPSAGPGAAGAGEETWNFGLGLTWYPGANAALPSLAGNCNMPYMPVANNGNFLVDRVVVP